jgi:hypothetical protein
MDAAERDARDLALTDEPPWIEVGRARVSDLRNVNEREGIATIAADLVDVIALVPVA